ncbi:MAG TPA: sigma-54-dependent Fis family transcriptional regulator [Myxococcales bacterium]|nr:sigma-54-dependent Fis family transcriptional regulator [Myxococcales bacterium]
MDESWKASRQSKISRGSGQSYDNRPKILVIDDSEGVRGYLADLLEVRGYAVKSAEDGEAAIALIENSSAMPDLVLLDIMMPGMGGIETLRRLREIMPGLSVAMISVVGRAPTIVSAMQLGAVDFINKPFEEEELDQVLNHFVPIQSRDSSDGEISSDVDESVWDGEAMREIAGVIEQISDTDVTVLVQGESGVGKEIVARSIHNRSTRADEPFVKVNCAALPEDLLESELFGYEKGAFTGAYARKFGKFEQASEGTIFLDEIGEMSPGLQAKLLQVLQDRRFTRLGGNKDVDVNVRIVCATHRPLLEMVANNEFREDLYFRLNVVNIQIPPLRDRREEIESLVEKFVERYGRKYGRSTDGISKAMMTAFRSYDFPGNVRELENMVKRIVVLGSEDSVLAELVEREASQRDSSAGFDALLAEIEATAGKVPLREVSRRAAREVEREAIDLALRMTDWNRKKAATLLGVSYKTLLHKIRECDLVAEI